MRRDPTRFTDRTEAGRLLAERLKTRRFDAPVVLALPRGGVPVAVEIARALRAPLDLVLVRKIGVPFQPELAAAAVVDGGSPEIVCNDEILAGTGMTRADIEELAKAELKEIERRRHVYLEGRPRPLIEGHDIILVDDGIATGASIRAAVVALKRSGPRRLVLAVPVAPPDAVALLRREVDEVVCLAMPHPFYSIGFHYRDFHQVPDAEVVALLRAADAAAGAGEGKAAEGSVPAGPN